jgi:hypothetical protein
MVRRSRFTQADIIRAIKGFQNAGLEVGAVHIAPDGTITVIRKGYESDFDKSDWFKGSPLYAGRNEWDDLL